ncbi:hypothetical protein Acr_03g0017500 [Actinidia rufa]|uniref:Uncharacterized protein n=1 Tax=Actinidia rufa TaxID=165716 RepID=A0A7J0EFL5_9ERIC|nr:hypothetical protein Acr_03g0017500 [Actinidia rufa]
MIFPKSLLAKLFIFMILLFTSTNVQVGNAMRPLNGKKWLESHVPVLQAYREGPCHPPGVILARISLARARGFARESMSIVGHVVRAVLAFHGAIANIYLYEYSGFLCR